MLKYLIGFIVLGLISAAFSYYNKNYYVRVFNDILGREEDEGSAARTGRGFFYGFLLAIYFVLLVFGLVALIAFLITAGIIAAIVFVLVWITEKILPNEWIGGLCIQLFEKIGLRGPVTPPAPAPTNEATETKAE